jgi:hypothetical protein
VRNESLDSAWERTDTWYAAIAGLAGLVARLTYLTFLDVAPYDPWRHLQLLDNLRAGLGFTLFDGQPYLWYSPVWHVFLAALPEVFRPDWAATLLSALAVPLFYGFLRSAESRNVALTGALVFALCGPVVRFTCHYGPEAFALSLTLAALWLFRSRLAVVWAACAGLLYGTALIARMNFLFVAPMFAPGLRTPARGLAFGAGAFVPLALTWWRNHTIISAHDWVFTWDGLATRSVDFTPLSTLIVQLHPAVNEGLRRLHEIIVPVPEWTRSWWLIVFVVLGGLAGLLARRLWIGVTIVGTLFYFLVLDNGMSSNYFRIYLVLFPAFAYCVALAGERMARSRAAGPLLAVAFVLAGAPMFRPPQMVPLRMTAPPAGLLEDELYLVNSGFYHPESLMRLYPDSRFIGLPIDAGQLEEFLSDYPQARKVLWHSFSVQDDVREALLARPGTNLVRTGLNDFDRRYTVLALGEAGDAEDP